MGCRALNNAASLRPSAAVPATRERSTAGAHTLVIVSSSVDAGAFRPPERHAELRRRAGGRQN